MVICPQAKEGCHPTPKPARPRPLNPLHAGTLTQTTRDLSLVHCRLTSAAAASASDAWPVLGGCQAMGLGSQTRGSTAVAAAGEGKEEAALRGAKEGRVLARSSDDRAEKLAGDRVMEARCQVPPSVTRSIGPFGGERQQVSIR